VRNTGDGVGGLLKGSRQAYHARGDQWVLINNGSELRNEVGEVARFEPADFSIQVHGTISQKIEERCGKCCLIYVKYFPFLRDRSWAQADSWLYDYVGCLVLLKNSDSSFENEYRRIGVVFIRLEDWISLGIEIEAIRIV
jgi:hypothetical protein